MTCGLDIGCHLAAALAPIWAFVLAWWWVPFGAGLMLLGAWMGPRGTVTVLTIGLGLLVYDRVRRAPEPDYETGEPPAPRPPPRSASARGAGPDGSLSKSGD